MVEKAQSAAVKYTVVGTRTADVKKELAHRFRREMPVAEAELWQELRRSQLGGLHFRRQQVIEGFIVDFYCHAAALVVEVDGDVHTETREYDDERDAILAHRGFRVLRVTNPGVQHAMPAVLERIMRAANSR